jgi:hypothetical protein
MIAVAIGVLRTNLDQVAQRGAEECVGADRQPRIEVTEGPTSQAVPASLSEKASLELLPLSLNDLSRTSRVMEREGLRLKIAACEEKLRQQHY